MGTKYYCKIQKVIKTSLYQRWNCTKMENQNEWSGRVIIYIQCTNRNYAGSQFLLEPQYGHCLHPLLTICHSRSCSRSYPRSCSYSRSLTLSLSHSLSVPLSDSLNKSFDSHNMWIHYFANQTRIWETHRRNAYGKRIWEIQIEGKYE